MRMNVDFSEIDSVIDVDFSKKHVKLKADFGKVTELRNPELEAQIRAEGFEAGQEAAYSYVSPVLTALLEGGIE